MNKKRIVFDPGHGGKDCGAIGWIKNEEGTFPVYEKDITLSVAKYCKRYIAKNDLDFIPYLTRESDFYVSLSGRCALANSLRADFFISIHCNARNRKGKYGLEFETFHHKSSEEGKKMGDSILESLIKTLNYDELPEFIRRNDSANFAVLRHTAMPSVLVELGFMTDEEEVQFLNQLHNQAMLAKGIVDGIANYYGFSVG